MSTNLASKITKYTEFFRQKVTRLQGYQLHDEDRDLKKIVLVSLLDAMSLTTPNKGKRTRERFTGIVRDFGGWTDHSRISAQLISYCFRHLSSSRYEPARGFIAAIVKKNSRAGSAPLTIDPTFEEVRILWPVPPDKEVAGKLSLCSFTHLNLFYRYRNSLVHEHREPGYGIEDDHDNEPFYLSTEPHDAPDQSTLELVYPLGFYFWLTGNVIDNVEQYLRQGCPDRRASGNRVAPRYSMPDLARCEP